MFDKNGAEIRTGDVIEISGRTVKNDNGRFLVTAAPGDPGWSGGCLSLHKVGKTGKLLQSGYVINHFPERREEGTAERISITDNPPAREYFTNQAAEYRERAEKEKRRFGESDAWRRLSENASFCDAVAARVCSAAAWEQAVKVKAEKAESAAGIRFYWNGIKVDGGKLIPCYFHDSGDGISIYARDYSRDLPKEYFNVINNSDGMTDYFEKDHTVVTPEHPLYKYARYACLKQAAHDAGKDSPAACALSAARNPGQPTAADLDAVKAMKAAEENARRAAEEAARIAAREQALKERKEGRDYINAQAAAHPVKDGEPVVTIMYSESPVFSAFPEGLRLSVAAAEIVIKHFDERKHAEHDGYDKTGFQIDYQDPETGEQRTYDGRYDLGDNDGGLIAHIRAYGEYLARDSTPAPMRDKNKGAETCAFADFLERFTASGKVVSVSFAPGIIDSLRGWKVLKTGTAAEKKSFREWEQIMNTVDLFTDEQLQAAVMSVSHSDESAIDVVRFFCQRLAERDQKKAAETFLRWKLGNLGGK